MQNRMHPLASISMHCSFLFCFYDHQKCVEVIICLTTKYLVDNGCKWRSLPHDFPPYTTVSNFYHAAVKSGLWEKLLMALVSITREEDNRKAAPSYRIIDSQSVKTTGASEERGIDGGKKQKGASSIL